MKHILTDSDRTKAYEDLMGQSLRSQDTEAVLQYARAIEQRILEKIGEAVGTVDAICDEQIIPMYRLGRTTSLYAIPFLEGE